MPTGPPGNGQTATVECVSPMQIWIRRLIPLTVVACVALSVPVAFGKTSRGGRLTGAWSGYILGAPGSGIRRQHMRVVVNARETGGSWKISATCYGALTLESISSGYHHYFRKLAHGATCASGYVDCLKRAGANVYDAVTSPRGGEYDSGGTLRPVGLGRGDR
jgi:hypothetical protein